MPLLSKAAARLRNQIEENVRSMLLEENVEYSCEDGVQEFSFPDSLPPGAALHFLILAERSQVEATCLLLVSFPEGNEVAARVLAEASENYSEVELTDFCPDEYGCWIGVGTNLAPKAAIAILATLCLLPDDVSVRTDMNLSFTGGA